MQQITEKPILFSRHMVNAILDGSKTQTRRIIKPQPASVSYWRRGEPSDRLNGFPSLRDAEGRGWAMCGPFKCPYLPHGLTICGGGALVNASVTDITDRRARLWVKETWKTFERPEDGLDGVVFRSDGAFNPIENSQAASEKWMIANAKCKNGKLWRPSIFMPRWVSRINLEITNIRVERLQEITEADAEAEGVDFMRHIPDADETLTARKLYEILWESINGEKSWRANPWVWVITFKRV